jgi:leucyl aminopeptidase (aminopeptidase T)
MSLLLLLILTVRPEEDEKQVPDLHAFTDLIKRHRELQARLTKLQSENPDSESETAKSEKDSILNEINDIRAKQQEMMPKNGFAGLSGDVKERLKSLYGQQHPAKPEQIMSGLNPARRKKMENTIKWLSAIACGILALILILTAKFISIAMGRHRKRKAPIEKPA